MSPSVQIGLAKNVRPVYSKGMKLAEFMHEKGLSDEALGAALDVSRVTISRLRREKAEPSFELLKRLAAYSRGSVTPNDFLPHAPRLRSSSHQAVA